MPGCKVRVECGVHSRRSGLRAGESLAGVRLVSEAQSAAVIVWRSRCRVEATYDKPVPVSLTVTLLGRLEDTTRIQLDPFRAACF